MTTPRSEASRRAPRRTPCNLAALMALGLLAGAAAPALAVQSTNGTRLLDNVVLRGLVSDYSQSATFAAAPVPTGQTLTITQLLPRIILDWNRFNLGNGDTIQFVQPSSSAAVLNRIHDQDPTTISGAIKANGQVYLVNQNGILFHRGTQIDTNSFFASTLNIDDATFKAGVTSGGNFTPAFAGRYDAAGATVTTGPDSGGIVIGGGSAALPAPSINAAAGGAVVIIAPVIDNDSGILKSPDGQVILAAGRAAYLSFGARDTTASFRGMLVEVTADNGAPLNLSNLIAGSSVTNAGDVSADRGNVTLAGLAINQSGRVSAKSAMLANGSIYLQARTLGDTQRGSVTLSADSVTETPLDLSDTTTLHASTSFDPYRPVVQISGRKIDVEGRITSPSGNVALDAKDPTGLATPRIYLGDGSVIDASGAWSTASDSSNLLTFKVTSTELKTAPDQQTGVLLGATVTVDLRQGSNVLDLSGYQANQAQTLQQKAAAGGVVTLSSGGDVIERSDAAIKVSGGGVHYTGATEATSKLLGADGKLYDIATAPEALRYKSLADSFTDTQSRWGYSPVYTNLLMGASLKRPDYAQGAAGGQLSILTGPAVAGVVLDGKLLGGSTTGSQQTAAAPRGASLVIGSYAATATSQRTGIGDVTFQPGSPSSLPAGFSTDSTLSDLRKTQVNLSTDVLAAGNVDASGNYVTTGFGAVEVDANGRITVPENVTINGPLGGALTLRANQVAIDGHVNLPGGKVTGQTIPTAGTAASPVAASGIVVIQGAGITTTGEWINNAITGQQSPLPSAMANPVAEGQAAVAPTPTTNGGSITLQGPVVQLAAGSVLDVSAGGSVSTRSAVSGGSAGAIVLAATAAPTATAAPLTLDGALTGYGFGSGGSLSLSTADAVRIVAAGAPPAASGMTLDAAFFGQGGFQTYQVNAGGDLTVAAGAVLLARQQSLQARAADAAALPTGANARDAAEVLTLPEDARKPASIALGSSGQLTLQQGSGIVADAGASVSLTGLTGLAVDGAVRAPGGTIALADGFTGVSPGTPDSALPVIELGSRAVVSAQGTFTSQPDDKGLALGTLYAGGAVNVTASAARVVLDAGSVIDVSGSSHVVDVPAAPGAGVPYREVRQSSNAGTVSISANDGVTLGGALRGTADAGAAGGSFSLKLTQRGDVADPTSGRRIVVTQSGAAQPPAAAFKDVAVSVDKLSGGGFDKLNLAAEDQVVFATDATLAFKRGVTLDTKLVQVANDANVAVSGAAVRLADSFGVRQRKNPDDPADLSTFVNATAASVPQATTAGRGTLRVDADTLDVAGSVTLGGVAATTLAAAHDLRLSGRPVGQASSPAGATLTGALVTAGDLTLSAAQVYPTTGSSFTVAVADGLTGVGTPSGRLTVAHGGGTRGDVLSAGGKLTLAADVIAQDGVLEVPLGTLSLQAGKTLTLGGNSVTSVSANGLTIPYGETQNGVTWTYAPLGSNPLTSSLSAPPAKNIALNAPAVDILNGAKVDVSGGGDVAAIEYVPSGNGGNALLAPNTYAILPRAMLSAAPVDPDIASNLGKLGPVYDSLHIGPGAAVPAGDYVLLPGYYGLLKGGYVVQLLTGGGYASLQDGQTATLLNGLQVVPGRLETAGTGVVAGTTIGVLVRPDTDIPRFASYTFTDSAYFATLAATARSAAPVLPADGGQLSIAATQRLTLDGTLAAALPNASSRSAQVDISAAKIALVDQVGRGDVDPSYLQISAAGLSKLDADLLIGGVRSTTGSGQVVTTTASDIVVANSASQPLDSPALMLAATDAITVRAGSRIDGTGAQAIKPVDFKMAGAGAASGAVLRVSTGGLADMTRPGIDPSQGTIVIESGATVGADGSLALDATRTTKSSGTLDIAKGGALALVSGSVGLGETDGVAGLDSGLALDNADLAAFATLGTLSIKSYGGIMLFGNARVGSAGLANLVLDGAALTGRSLGAPAAATIAGRNVSLVNTSGTDAAPGAAGAGTLSVVATQQLTLGAGSKQIAGFSDTQLSATGDATSAGQIVASGSGSLQTASTLELTAARIASVSGADQAWTAQDATAAGGGYRSVTIAGSGSSAAPADATALGSRLRITGSSVVDGGAVVMKAGGVVLQAMNGNVELKAGASLDAGGASKSFQGSVATADAGQVTLSADRGNVLVDKGSSVNLAADAAGGNAGSLTISGVGADLSGSLSASSAKGTPGSIALNLATLADAVPTNAAAGGFPAINATLNAAGFTESRDIRVRDEDLAVVAGDVVRAHHLALESDSGSVRVAGRLDASAALGGGSIAVVGDSVAIAAGASLDASATSTDASASAPRADGGSVTLVAERGTLDFARGAVVDVRAGATGDAGSVLLRAPRTSGGGAPLAATLDGQVLSRRHAGDAAAQVAVEGNRVYTMAPGATVDAAAIAGYAADNAAFMQAAGAAPVGAGLVGDDGSAQGKVHVRPAVEVVSAGDLDVAANWDLTGAGWRIKPVGGGAAEAGSLAVRAAGNLTLSGVSIGNPDTSLQSGATWSIALTSGADLAAADSARTQSAAALAARAAGGAAGAGDLVLDSSASEASVRTGTGKVRIAAGRDFIIVAGADPLTGNPAPGVVTTSGTAAIRDPLTSAADSRFAQGGGDITITAQRDAIGSGNEWMTEWYRAATALDGGFANGVWWSARQNFHDGVAALGGGKVSVAAGRDLRDLSAWVPTSAIETGPAGAGSLETFGGGDLEVRAGRDIVGGQYLVSLGRGAITAGGDVGGAGQSAQLFLMGASGEAADPGATAAIRAGGSVRLATIANPGMVAQTPSTGTGPGFSDSPVLSMLSYSASSAVGVSALSGDIRIGNAPNAALLLNPVPGEDILAEQQNASNGVAALPPKVAFQAFGGSIVYTGGAADGSSATQVLFPAADGGVKLLAGKDVIGMQIRVSDVDPRQFDVSRTDTANTTSYSDILNGVGGAAGGRQVANTSKDAFINEVVALDGSVTGVTFKFPSRSRIWAAQDIFDATLSLQNLLPTDVSELVARNGSIVIGQPTGWGIDGPGALLLQAGRNVDLGVASLTSFGNLRNSALPAAGADIDVLAGYGGVIDLGQLPATFKKLQDAGNAKKPDDATAAIDALLDKSQVGPGDIDSFNTSIQTIAGGDINLMAPGGNITVGLPTPDKSKLVGVVTNAGGAIRSFLKGDFNINQGKVLTAQGGDILIYTTDGGIDAGRGARTSVTTPPPVRTAIVENGNIVGYSYSLPVAVAGSGIQTATSKPGGPDSVAPKAGDIFLFAPKGSIDAGEAGIKSGGAIFVAALTVLNADNISAVGASQGVPVAAPGSVAATVAASTGTATADTRTGDAAAQAAQAAAAAGVTNFRPAILTVEVMGFGERNCKETDKDCFAK